MSSKKIVSGLAFMLIGLGCSKGRDQYQAPPDQRVDKHADPAPTVVPAQPTGPDLGLIDSWYQEPTAEEEAKILQNAIYSPIVLGAGLAGIDISMTRSEIEAKLGQPDYVGTDSYLRPVGVYGGGSFLIFYDRVTKSKVENLIASNGYLGAIPKFDLKVGSDLAPLLAAEGGTAGLMKKIYKEFAPGVEDCNAAGLCQALKGTNLGLMALTNTVQILFQDDPNKPEKKIFEIRVLSRTPDAGRFQAAWNFDLVDSTLSRLDEPEAPTLKAGTATWADVRAAGALEALVEPRDFGRSLVSFSVGLSNDLNFSFARGNVTDKSAKAPVDSDKLSMISSGVSFTGQLSVGGQPLLYQICPAGDALGEEDAKRALVVRTSLLSGKAGGPQTPSGEPVETRWLPSVVAQNKAGADCVQVPLASDLASVLTNSFQTLVLKQNAEWLGGNTADLVRTVYIETVDGKAPLAARTGPDGSLEGAVDPTLGFGKTIFNAAFEAVLEAAKAKNPNTFDYGPSGFRSLEEKATFSRVLGIFDETFSSGLEISLSYAEASKAIYFDSVVVSPEFANNNIGLKILQKTETGYAIDLDGPLSVDGLQIASSAGPATTIAFDPFDRSLRYAKISYGAEAPVSDYATYSERVVLNITNGSSVISKTHDVYISTRGLIVTGKRTKGRPETSQVLSVDGLGFSSFPYATKMSLTCGEKPVELTVNEAFNSVYEKVKTCKKFLTPGHGANNVPSELHLAPEGIREHALTLDFTDGLLNGFLVYNVN